MFRLQLWLSHSGYIAIKLMIFFGINNLFMAFFLAGSVGVLLGLVNGIIIHKFNMARP